MAAVARVARAHSIGEAADQKVPHMHIHIHPRQIGDGLLRIYPSMASEPPTKNQATCAGGSFATTPPFISGGQGSISDFRPAVQHTA